MSAMHLRALLQHLRRLVGPERHGGLTDAHLVERFVNERDEAAFEVLVWRHGPMVLSVCRRVLRQEQDAEDAFQATFLTLVRKVRSIGKRQAVAGWLYQVAYRVALEAKTRAAQRLVHEKQVAKTVSARATQQPAEVALRADVSAILCEEVSRLPEKYRTPVVLCYLQGKTYDEAARELGCPKGTVSIRLMRARELLRSRLARRGLSLSGGMLVAALSENATAALVSQCLVDVTVKSALLFAASKTAAAALSGQAVALTEGVLKAMFMTKLKIAAAFLLVVGLAGSGAGLLTYGGTATGRSNPQAENVAPPPAAEQEDENAKPARPAVRTNDDKLKAARVSKETEEARVQHERQLLVAMDYLRSLERKEDEQEKRWLKELIEARLRIMDAGDKLRRIEHEQESSKTPVYEQLKAAQSELAQAESYYTDKDNPRIIYRRDSIRRLQEEWGKTKDNYARILVEARTGFIEAEESLHRLERSQASQRERFRRRLEAADERIRLLEEASSSASVPRQGLLELEKKVDRLLLELAKLRREIRQQPAEGEKQVRPPP